MSDLCILFIYHQNGRTDLDKFFHSSGSPTRKRATIRNLGYLTWQIYGKKNKSTTQPPPWCLCKIHLTDCASWHQCRGGSLPGSSVNLVAFGGFQTAITKQNQVMKFNKMDPGSCDKTAFYKHPNTTNQIPKMNNVIIIKLNLYPELYP